MSDHVLQSDHGSDGLVKKPLYLHQSVWMAHWMHTSCKPKSQGLDPLSIHSSYREGWDNKQMGLEIPSSICKSTERVREISESGTVNSINESLKLGSENFGSERLESQSYPKSNLTHNKDIIMTPRNLATGDGVVSEMGASSAGGHFQNGVPGNIRQQAKSPAESLKKKALVVSTSFQHEVGSNKIVPHRYNSGNSLVDSTRQQEELNQPSHLVTSKEHWEKTTFPNYSTSLMQEKKLKYSIPVFFGKREDLQNHHGTRTFPKWSSPLVPTKSDTVLHGFFSAPKISGSLPNVEKMGICSTVDSAVELSGRVSKFSQMTHHFMINKKTGINLSEGVEMFRESTFSTNNKGKLLNKFLILSPGFGNWIQHGVRLQPVRGSSDNEERENFGDVKTSKLFLKNESSAETDTMDMHCFKKDRFSGVPSFKTNEIKKWAQVPSTSQAALDPSTDRTGGRLPASELPGMNEELPAVDDRETSSSRTQSLDVDHLLSHAELPTNSKSICVPGGHVQSEPSIRWVKRLKLGGSDTCAHGSKSSKMEEASSHEKGNHFFSKIMTHSMTSSEPKMGKCPGREPRAPDQTAVLLRTGESSSTESRRKTQKVVPFTPWLQRWCHQRDVCPMQNRETLVVCEPQKSDAASDEFRKKQFPSIAAMTLMRKALNSFQPCEFRNRGTYVVWSN